MFIDKYFLKILNEVIKLKNAQNLEFFLKFKEKYSLLYRKIKELLYNFKFDSIIYFDRIDILAKNILNQYNLIERQILIRCLIFEIDPELIKYFEIFPHNNILNLKSKRNEYNKNQNFDYFCLEKSTLDVLNHIEKLEGSFKLFE